MNIRLPHPLMLWVEPSANCNLDCDGCPTAAGRRGGQMRATEFQRLLEQLPWLRVVNFWHRGEPLLAPDFPEMVAAAAGRRIWTQTHTNGILLAGGDTARRLVATGLNRITVGIDGPDEATYRRYRSGGSLTAVEAGVRALVDARNRLKTRRPRIVAECLISGQTQDQFRHVREKALAWGCDGVKFKTYKVPRLHDTDDALTRLPENPALWRYERVNGELRMKRRRDTCRRLAWSAVIAWNGDVFPCCFWTHDFTPAGNAFRQPWREIWRGEGLAAFQRTVNAERDKIGMCRNCTEGLHRLYLPEKMVTG